MPAWTNWSGNIRAMPYRVEVPASENDVVDVVNRARGEGLTVRPAGSRHSFVPLCATDGVAVDLHALAGVESIDHEARIATVLGGTRLSAIGKPLRDAGLALHNQGDVDTQTITGAIGTGTHGTGPTLRNLSSAVVGVRVVTGAGEVLTCSPAQNSDIYEAARLSLGAVGIITAVTLQCEPAYNLHERIWFEDPDSSLAALDERIAATRHYEFFWHPQRDLFEHKALHPTDDAPDVLPAHKRQRIDASYRIFPSVRERRFNEMEYAVPAAAGRACFDEIRALIRTRRPDLDWPVEYRTLAADDLWLSPAHGRPTVTISVHQGAELPYDQLFSECEAIFRTYDGRPHWGKVHSATSADLEQQLPMWARFQRAREVADADGVFLNDYLRRLLGFDASGSRRTNGGFTTRASST